MSPGRRVSTEQVARRINAAAALLQRGFELSEAARVLARRQSVSERQARRYLEQAASTGRVEVPSAKRVFTVKLPGDVIQRVRRQARRRGQAISVLVAQALLEFLARIEASGGGGRQAD